MNISKTACDGYLSAFRDGDTSAFDSLYRETYKLMYSYALSVTNDAHLADDASQEAFIKIYRKASTYKTGSNPIAWMISIVRNASLDLMRERSGERAAEIRVSVRSPEDGVASRDSVRDILSHLGKKEREVVVLRVYGGCTVEEAAEALGISFGSANWRYHSAVKKLRKLLEKEKNQ